MSDLSLQSLTHVSNFKDFKRVCRINDYFGEWIYDRIDPSIMYSDHTCWVYFITVNGHIYKIGASGVPLGIQMSDGQPKKGTKCRLGRYRAMKGTYSYDTDEYCRNELRGIIYDKTNLVEFWAYKCPIIKQQLIMGGETITVESSIQWDLEKALLNQFEKLTGGLPKLNRGKA
jgi:hypothetical protein